MDTISRFAEYISANGLSFRDAAAMVGCNKGTLHSVLTRKRKPADHVLVGMTRVLDGYVVKKD